MEGGREGKKVRGENNLQVLESPTSPAGPVVVPTSEDSRAMGRHTGGISAVPGAVVESVRSSSARATTGATAGSGSFAVVALDQSIALGHPVAGVAV